MYKREHHNRIAAQLEKMKAPLFDKAACFFGGGTSIVMQLGEYRESVDVDFVVSTREGYALIRQAIADEGMAGIMRDPPPLHREIRTDRDKIVAWLDPDPGTLRPIKFEVFYEGRIDVQGIPSPWGIQMLSQESMFAEKLLANADRYNDKSSASRDALDLAIMIEHWGPIPDAAWETTCRVYGTSVYDAFGKAVQRLNDDQYFNQCMVDMQVDADGTVLLARLHGQARLCGDRIPSHQQVMESIKAYEERAITKSAAIIQEAPSAALIQFLDKALYQEAHTLQQVNAQCGRYSGPIVWTDGMHTVQSVGKSTLVMHGTRDWYPTPQVGYSLTVEYRDGVSYPIEKGNDRVRSRDHGR